MTKNDQEPQELGDDARLREDDAMSQPTPCCLELRCKSLTYRADERPGMVHASETMTYWCALTSTDDGPDRELVEHGACQPGRACFRGPQWT